MEYRYKKVLLGVISVLLIVVFSACTKSEDTPPTEIIKATPTPFPTAVPDTGACEMEARLQVGGQGKVVSADTISVYGTAGDPATNVGQIQPENVFNVISGPQCIDGANWWEISIYNFIGGWVIEGQQNTYFLEPVVSGLAII